MWNHPSLFPVIVFFAASLMLFRLVTAWRFTAGRRLARKAIAPAIALLSLFMAGTAGGIVVYFDFSGELLNWPPWVNNSVVVLLMVGIGVTFFAVFTTEGPPFGKLRDASDWTRKSGNTVEGEG